MVNREVLILDDESAICQSFEYFFEDRGWKTVPFSNAEEALAYTASNRCPCAIVDIRLPGISGDQFIVRALELNPLMVFVICTGSPEYNEDNAPFDPNRVSTKIFDKPLTDIEQIEAELLRLLDLVSKDGPNG